MNTTLTIGYEGDNEVMTTQENNLNWKQEHRFTYTNESLTHDFNPFNCLTKDMRRFNIINHNNVLVLKVLDSLDEKLEQYVDVLKNILKIKTMDLQSLIGNLRNYDQCKIQREEIMQGSIKDKSLSLILNKSNFLLDSDNDNTITLTLMMKSTRISLNQHLTQQ